MNRVFRRWCAIVVLAATSAHAAEPPDASALLDAQRAAMKPFARFDGVWRGRATVTGRDGRKVDITHTERVGSLLDGTLKVIEGRSYDASGNVAFNAFGVISYDVERKGCRFHSYAQGRAGDFEMDATPDGYVWSITVGTMKIRYTATVRDDVWTEVGERLVEGESPVRLFEMRVVRVGTTDWPAAGAVPRR